MVQTGPKIQLGGAKKGLLSVAYQVGMAATVNGVPASPTNSQPSMEISNFCQCFIGDSMNLICQVGNQFCKIASCGDDCWLWECVVT